MLPDDYRQTFEQYTNLRSKLQMYKLAERDHEYGRHTRQWLWLLVGPAVAAALTLSLWLFTDAAFLQRCVGGDAFGHSSTIPILTMAVGTTFNGLLTVHGIALQIWAVACLVVGAALLLHSANDDLALAGASLIALGLPSVWWITIGTVRKLSVHGAVGRVFGAMAPALWVFLQLHEAAVRGTESALFGNRSTLRGDLRPFGWSVVGTWSLFIVTESAVECYFNFGITADKVAAAKRVPLTTRLFTLHKQSLWKPFLAAWLPACVVGGALALVLLSSALLWNAGQLWKQSLQETVDAISGSPDQNTWRFTVATLNVAGGYDTSGMDNVACVRHVLKGLRTLPEEAVGAYVAADPNVTKYNSGIGELPLLIGLQESEASVNCHCCHREITSALARDLHLHAYDGRAALDPAKAGLGTLSQLPITGETIAFSTQDSGMQRTFTRSNVTLRDGGVSLTLLNTQTSYSADGSLAAEQIAELSAYAAALSGPVVITADFNLFADGFSVQRSSGAASAWDPLLAAGFSSVTPLNGVGAEEVYGPDGTTRLYYQSPMASSGDGGFTGSSTGGTGGTAHISTWHFPGSAVERPGYQTDYIWYRGLHVSVEDAKVPGGWRIAHNWRWDADEGNLGLGRWATELDNATHVSCTHHRPLIASFVLVAD